VKNSPIFRIMLTPPSYLGEILKYEVARYMPRMHRGCACDALRTRRIVSRNLSVALRGSSGVFMGMV
jgi:hypothetical protein